MNQSSFKSARDLVKFVNGVYAITDVDVTEESVTVFGDLTQRLAPTDTFDIAGSTGNNGTWTVDTIVFDGTHTTIVVTTDITDATVDGDVELTQIVTGKIQSIHESDGQWWLLWWD